MRILGKTIAIALIATGSFLQCANAAQIVAGKIISSVGQVYTTNSGSNSVILKRGSAVHVGDTIYTDKNSYVQFITNDGTIVDIDPETRYKIAEYSYSNEAQTKGRFVGNLIKGGLLTLSGNISKNNPHGLEVNTNAVAIGARGTFFSVSSNGGCQISSANIKSHVACQTSESSKVKTVFLSGHGYGRLKKGQEFSIGDRRGATSAEIMGGGNVSYNDKSTELLSSIPFSTNIQSPISGPGQSSSSSIAAINTISNEVVQQSANAIAPNTITNVSGGGFINGSSDSGAAAAGVAGIITKKEIPDTPPPPPRPPRR